MLPHLGSPLTAVLMAYASFLSLSEALGRVGPSAVTLVGDLNLSDRPRGSLMLFPGTSSTSISTSSCFNLIFISVFLARSPSGSSLYTVLFLS